MIAELSSTREPGEVKRAKGRKNEPEDTLPRSGYGSEMIRIGATDWKLRETHVFRVPTKMSQQTSIR